MELLQSLVDLGRNNPVALLLVIIAFILVCMALGGLIVLQREKGRQKRVDSRAIQEQATIALTSKLVDAITDGLGKVKSAVDHNSDIASEANRANSRGLTEIQHSLDANQHQIVDAFKQQADAARNQATKTELQTLSLNTQSEQLERLISGTEDSASRFESGIGKLQDVMQATSGKTTEDLIVHTTTLADGLRGRMDDQKATLGSIDAKINALPDKVAERLESTLADIRSTLATAQKSLEAIERQLQDMKPQQGLVLATEGQESKS